MTPPNVKQIFVDVDSDEHFKRRKPENKQNRSDNRLISTPNHLNIILHIEGEI
jgi:hypothetical protein